MSDQGPLSQRDCWYLIFPAWFVDYVLAPFPDESGWGVVILRWVLEGLTLAVAVVALVPYGLLLPLIVGLAWTLLSILVLMSVLQ
jgi:hypothetical protein